MTALPQVRADRVFRALIRAGFLEAHRKGSHVTLIHAQDPTRVAVLPLHKGRDIRAGTLRAILRGARLSVDELNALL